MENTLTEKRVELNSIKRQLVLDSRRVEIVYVEGGTVQLRIEGQTPNAFVCTEMPIDALNEINRNTNDLKRRIEPEPVAHTAKAKKRLKAKR